MSGHDIGTRNAIENDQALEMLLVSLCCSQDIGTRSAIELFFKYTSCQ